MLRKYVLLVVALCVVTSCAFAATGEKAFDNQVIASVEGKGPTAMAPSVYICNFVRDYKNWTLKKDKIRSTFKNLHGITNAEGGTNEAQLVIPPEDQILPAVKMRLWALANFLGAQDVKGGGSGEYWLQTFSLIKNQNAIVVKMLDEMNTSFGGQMNGLLRAALRNVRNELNEAAHKFDGKRGDLIFWRDASGFLCDACWLACRNLGAINDVLVIPEELKQNRANREALIIISTYLISQICAEPGVRGDAKFWYRTLRILRIQLITAVTDLQALIQFDPQMKHLLKVALNNVNNSLNEMAHRFDEKDGIGDFWIDASELMRDQAHRAGESLQEIIKNM
ncbi:MAG: hypothetical protein WA705_20270 [Candidatus Ozemobacteraceae bacterium]